MRSARDPRRAQALTPTPPGKLGRAAGRIAALLAAPLLATSLLAGCGAGAGPFEDTEDLKAFLSGEDPIPDERAEIAKLNETFARQSVRAHGYQREGVGDATEDGWSPVVRASDGNAQPADITPWIDGGDINKDGRFVPTADLCDPIGPVPTDGLPEDARSLDNLQVRLTSLSCAIHRLAGGETEITWTDPSAAALSIAEPGGAALVNPRLLHLVVPAGVTPEEAPESPGLEPASAGPEDDEILIDEGDGNQHHPRPKPDPDDSSGGTDSEDVAQCVDTCAKACDVLVTILAACESSEATSSDTSGACETSVPGTKSGPLQPILFSLGLVASIALRRRGKRRPDRALFLAPLFLLLFNGSLARAQTPPKAPAPPPPAPEAPEAAPPAPPKDWKQSHQEGLKQLDEKNYGEAIRLLREAYLLNPTADKLEAIARAQRGAGQTHKAIQTLEHARAQFGESLTDEKYAAITADIDAMKGELVTIRIITRPIDATIAIDGEELPPGAAATPIEIGPGSHKFSASADGYATGFKTVDIGPGRETQDVVLNLPPSKIFLFVTARSPDAAILVDNQEVGRGEWWGFVEPGAHAVRIEEPDGAVTFDVTGAAGEAIRLPNRTDPLTYPGMPEPQTPGSTPEFSDFYGSDEQKPEFRETGVYFFSNASILWNTTNLYGFEDPNLVPGIAIGVRGGWRPYSNLSFELLLEYSYFGRTAELTQVFDRDEDGDGLTDYLTARDDATYAIHDVRLGPVLRFMSDGTKHRGIFGLGLGVLYEEITLDHVDYKHNNATQTWNNEGLFHHSYGGVGAFFLAEAGYERSMGNLLLGGVFSLSLDALGGINGKPYDQSTNVRVGLAFRVGYSAWKLEQVKPENKSAIQNP